MTSPYGGLSLYAQLPQVPWLYIHDVVVRRVDTAAGAVDAEGRWLPGQSVTRHPARGLVSMVGPERTVTGPTTGTAREETVDAVVRLPRNTEVRYPDEMEVRGVSFDLDGLYRIVQVRYNPVDLRVLLHRVADDPDFLGQTGFEPFVPSGTFPSSGTYPTGS